MTVPLKLKVAEKIDILPKQTILKKNKSVKQIKYKNRKKAYPTFYILHYSLSIFFLILLLNKTKEEKETRMSQDNNTQIHNFFLNNILEI